MQSVCPRCEAKLSEYAFKCTDCGWDLLAGDTDSDDNGLDQQLSETELHLQKANESIGLEKFDNAIISLNRAISDAEPDQLAECLRLRGYCHLRLGKFDQAATDCSASLSHERDQPQTLAWRAAAYGEQNKWRLAIADLAKACNLAGDGRDPYLNLLLKYKNSAGKYFAAVVQERKPSVEIFNERGWAYLLADDFEKAKRDFQLALDLSPKHPWANLGMANLIYADKKSFSPDSVERLLPHCELAMQGPRQCKIDSLHLQAQTNHALGRVAKLTKDLKHLQLLVGDEVEDLLRCGELKKSVDFPISALADFSKAIQLVPDRHVALKMRADCYSEIDNYALAIADYTKYLRFHPNDVSARIRRGKSYLAMNKYFEAAKDFERVKKLNNKNFEARLGMAEACRRLKRLDEALAECQEAIAINNSRSDGFAQLAQIYMELCEYGLAIEEYGRAIHHAETDNLQADYMYQRGIAHYELNQNELAHHDLNLAAMLRPTHSGTWIWKAATCSRLEKWAEAIVGLKQAIAVNPGVATKYRQLGRPVAERAIEFFNQKQQRGAPDATLFRSRGLAYQFLRNQEKAVEDFTAALNFEPEHHETLIRRGQSFAQLGDHESAIDDFKSVIRTDKKNHRARYWRALSRFEVGQPQKALVDIVKAIRAAARVPAYHILHGELLWRNGQADRAISAFNRAARLDATDPQTYRRRAAVLMNQSEFVAAIRDLSRSLELQPGSPDAHLMRGNAFLKLGSLQDAKQDFEMALTFNERLAKAYSGRAAAMVNENKHEYLTIWLTKALHRFEAPRELSEILFARGKCFYRMRRFEPAILDFSTVIELMRGDTKTIIAARIARGIALAQLEKYDAAKQDFITIRKLAAKHPVVETALFWLDNPSGDKPEMFAAPEEMTRPTRPPVVGSEIEITSDERTWATDTPYATWILRTTNRKEYGPVRKDVLDEWVSEGRIVAGMKLLRADWGKWKKAERVYKVLETKEIEIFPALNLSTDDLNDPSN